MADTLVYVVAQQKPLYVVVKPQPKLAIRYSAPQGPAGPPAHSGFVELDPTLTTLTVHDAAVVAGSKIQATIKTAIPMAFSIWNIVDGSFDVITGANPTVGDQLHYSVS